MTTAAIVGALLSPSLVLSFPLAISKLGSLEVPVRFVAIVLEAALLGGVDDAVAVVVECAGVVAARVVAVLVAVLVAVDLVLVSGNVVLIDESIGGPIGDIVGSIVEVLAAGVVSMVEVLVLVSSVVVVVAVVAVTHQRMLRPQRVWRCVKGNFLASIYIMVATQFGSGPGNLSLIRDKRFLIREDSSNNHYSYSIGPLWYAVAIVRQ